MPESTSRPSSVPAANAEETAYDPTSDSDGHPLGPLISLSEDRDHLTRLTALMVFLGVAGIMGMAWYMNPDPKGIGTHQRLGLPPCGFLVTTGLPCPTCGMTTAFAHTVRGHLLEATRAQPAGTVLALFTIALGVVAVVVMITGRRLELNWYRINPMRVLVASLVIFVGSWTFKVVMVLLERPYAR